MTAKKVMITLPSYQHRIIDGLVKQGAAPTKSILIQQIISAFITQANHMRMTAPQPYTEPQTIESALEALISYFLFSLGKAAIDSLFESGKR